MPLQKKRIKHHNLTVLIEKDEDGFYVASVPALKSCYTQAKTLEELYPRIKEVVELCSYYEVNIEAFLSVVSGP